MTKTSTSNSWITCPKPNEKAKLQLFCFNYAGGRALGFRNWSDLLPDYIEVCPIELPGHGTRLMETPLINIESLVIELAQALVPNLTKPFVFFGHSMGALLCFELTRRLRQNYDLIPLHLFVSGFRAPHIPNRNPLIHNLPDQEFLNELRRYNGTPEDVINNAEIMELLLPILRADFTLLETYVYTPQSRLDCPITVFGGSEDWTTNSAELEEWKLHTNIKFLLQMLPGNHFFIDSAQMLLLNYLSQELNLYT